MGLVFRRARGAKGLLIAATGATLIATALLTGLTSYSRSVADAGTRSAVDSAPTTERSILVRGAAGGSADAVRTRDDALRAAVTDRLAGREVTVAAAGYSSGRQLTGDTGLAVPDSSGVVYASVTFLEGLTEHAELTAGNWPQPDGDPVQTVLAEPVAATLGAGVGDRLPIINRLDGQVTEVSVVGIWRARDVRDRYWRLAPDAAEGTSLQSATYGPLVVDRADFLTHFLTNASVAWLIEPDLDRITLPELQQLGQRADLLATRLPETTGLGGSGQADTRISALVDRLTRANLVGRSALVTPILLIVVLGGYTLFLVALLLHEHRRMETALLRARGAARGQIAGLVVREAALVVLPALLLAPILATELLRYADRLPALAAVALHLDPRIDGLALLATALAAIGCVLAMLFPALRRSGTYTEEMASRSRPDRRIAAARAGADVALAALAALAWLQLRQYSSPLSGSGPSGQLGIDPLLSATPTLAVLAGAVLALRLLPPATRFAERYVDRKPWTATMFGMWQAGRRPHAGPVLLLALAVAISTLAWCLASTSQRSLGDQADHQVGADLRLVEANGFAPENRSAQLAEVFGTGAVLPAWRESMRLGPTAEPSSLLAIDTVAGADVVRLRDDLVDGDPRDLLRSLAAGRDERPTAPLPDGGRLTGEIRTTTVELVRADFTLPLLAPVSSYAVLTTPSGGHRRLLLGSSDNGRPLRFSVPLPAGTGPLRLAGFLVETQGRPGLMVDWRLAGLHGVGGDGVASPVDLAREGGWQSVDFAAQAETANLDGEVLHSVYVEQGGQSRLYRSAQSVQLAVVPREPVGQLPVVATPQALAALRMNVGDQRKVPLGVAELDVRIIGVAETLPGQTKPAALLADLPSLSRKLFQERAVVRTAQEWWVAGTPDEQAVSRVRQLTGGLTVLDRDQVSAELARDPYGVGARAALFAAALGALLLAGVGIAVDIGATARRRINEFAVLNTLGAGPRLLARSLIAEQAFLAGLGVLVGLGVGIAVAATMAPLVVLTPSADRPSPPPALQIDWPPVAGTAVGLLALALALGTAVALTMRQRLVAAQLRIGEDR